MNEKHILMRPNLCLTWFSSQANQQVSYSHIFSRVFFTSLYLAVLVCCSSLAVSAQTKQQGQQGQQEQQQGQQDQQGPYFDDLSFWDQGLWNYDDWKVYGGNLHNTHSSFFERKINTRNAGRLSVKWIFTTGGDVSATPTIEGRALYVPDSGGNLFKLDTRDGSVIWTTRISDYTGNSASYSRNSPAITKHKIILGDQASGTVMAVDKYTGNLLWKTLVDPHPAAIITNSPVVVEDRIYVGVSSTESGVHNIGYQFSFRGSVNALDLHTGEIVWKTYTVPEGYTGGAVWGSSFPIDRRRGTLYATTGNNYVVPEGVASCIQQAPNPQAQLACLSPHDYVEQRSFPGSGNRANSMGQPGTGGGFLEHRLLLRCGFPMPQSAGTGF